MRQNTSLKQIRENKLSVVVKMIYTGEALTAQEPWEA